jgi:hypothetical protein
MIFRMLVKSSGEIDRFRYVMMDSIRDTLYHRDLERNT